MKSIFLLLACFMATSLAEQHVDPMVYLYKYGHLATGRSSSGGVKAAVTSLQNLAGLPPTGTLDSATLNVMKQDRCGTADRNTNAYGPPGTKWRTTRLTYKFSSFTNDLSRQQVRDIIRQAYKIWSDVTPLTFTEISSGKAHMEIKFARRYHGDNGPFDGQGGTLAHAYFPLVGDIHFDDDERYIDGRSGRGSTSLFYVAAHEIGHAIGLDHDSSKSALMYAFHVYFGSRHSFRLPSNDVRRIQRLYGAGGPNPRPNPTSNPRPRTSIPKPSCRDTSPYCRQYANQFNCIFNSYIIQRCQKTCRKCR